MEFSTIKDICQRSEDVNETSRSYYEFEKVALVSQNRVSYTVYTRNVTKFHGVGFQSVLNT